jgi:hypothetical protein
MRYVFVALLFGFGISAANAQVTLNLNQNDLQVIGEALAAMPYAKAAPVVQDLQMQIRSAQAKKQAETKKKPDLSKPPILPPPKPKK